MILGWPIDFLFGHSTSDNLHKLLILGWKRGRNILDAPHVNLLGGRQEKRRARCPRGSRGEVSAWRASNLRERSTDLMGEDGDRDSLISIPPSDPTANPMSAAAAPPQRKRGQRHWERWWKTPSKEVTCLQSLSLCDPALNKKQIIYCLIYCREHHALTTSPRPPQKTKNNFKLY